MMRNEHWFRNKVKFKTELKINYTTSTGKSKKFALAVRRAPAVIHVHIMERVVEQLYFVADAKQWSDGLREGVICIAAGGRGCTNCNIRNHRLIVCVTQLHACLLIHLSCKAS